MKKKHRRPFRKYRRVAFWLFIAFVIVGVGFLIINGAQACGLVSVKPEMLRDLPDNVESLFKIDTDSLYYYAEKCIETPEAVTITNFWTYEKNRWQFYEDTLSLIRASYYKIEVTAP